MTWRNISNDGSAQIFLEDFQFGNPPRTRKRPTWARARIKSVYNTKRFRSSVLPLSMREGFLGDHRPFNVEYGHLIGLSIGGHDVSENLVPMYGNVNRGDYRAVEREIELRVASAPSPVVLLKIAYPATGTGVDEDARVPSGFTFWLFDNMSDVTSAIPMGPILRNVENRRSNTVRLTIEGLADISRREFHMQLKDRTIRDGWKIEDLNGPAFDWAQRGWLPPVGSRPNGYLDRLVYDTEFASYAELLLPRWDRIDIGPGLKFAKAQRVNLIVANCYTQPGDKKGECWSDDPNDPIRSALTEKGTDNGIQVDHIFPMASGGPNIYSNAQILSSSSNRSKGRS